MGENEAVDEASSGYEGMDPRVLAYLEKNGKWARGERYEAPVRFTEMQAKGRAREDGTVIVLACTDPRCTPEEYLGMSSASGDKATIVRTAGARAQPALSTLYVLSAVGNLGKKGVIMVIGHTDCGLQGADDEEIRRLLVGAVDEGQEEKARGTLREARFGAFVRPDISVMEDVDMLTASPFFRGMEIVGFVQDTETGLVTEVSEWRVQENRKSDVQSREIEQAKANGGK